MGGARRELRVAGQAEPISHFTDAVEAGGFLFVSGIVPVDERRELVGGDDVVAQARCVFENMRAVLAAGGCTFADVVKVTVYLTDVNDRPLVNPVRQEVFGETRPASTLVEISALVIPGAKIEVECVAPPAVNDPFNTAITWLDEPLLGAAEGPLAGRTLLVKDLIDTAGIRTTYGSRIYGDHVPTAHATVVQRALDAGAVVVGKANLPEFAWGVLGVNPWYGAVHNPLHPGKTTGGSSAGNAAALAAGLVDLGLGTDTGCSIRLPSAACGTVGLKPRWGHLPIDGVFPLVPTLDTVGPMGAQRRGRRAPLVGALGPRRAGAPARGADGRAPAARTRDRRRARRPSRATRPTPGWPISSGSAPAWSSPRCPRRAATCGRSSSTRPSRATATRSPRAPRSTAR